MPVRGTCKHTCETFKKNCSLKCLLKLKKANENCSIVYLKEQSEKENTCGQVGGLGQRCHLFGPFRHCLCVAGGERQSSFYQHVGSLPDLPWRNRVMKVGDNSHMKLYSDFQVRSCNVIVLLEMERITAVPMHSNFNVFVSTQHLLIFHKPTSGITAKIHY